MTRTLFIGLDGATFTILDELTQAAPGQQPVMPFLSRVLKEGFHAKLRSTAHPLTPPAWTSLMTGRTPGHHGIYDFVRFEDQGHELFWTLYDFRDMRAETIWSIASRQNRHVASLNFPMMAPPKPVNGSVVAGFVSWKHLRRSMTPDGLFDRIKGIPGFDARELAWDFERESKIGEEMSQEDLEAWVLHHMPRENQWFRIAETLLREDNPDLFAIMFDGTDKIQHQAWHVMDPALRPEQPSESYIRLRDLVHGYFRAVDGYIEQLVRLAGPDTQLFMASDHGFTAAHNVVRINQYLGELGYLVWRTADGDTSEQARRRDQANFANLDWNKTTAFCPTPSSNGIYIRVADGPGKPGIPRSEYAAFRERLVADLKALRDPQTGEPVIREILLRERAFPGPAMRSAPDITVVLSDYGFVSVRNRAPAVVRRPTPAGTHHPDGIFIAWGKGVRAGTDETMSIVDVPAIMLHSLGLPVPEDFEGMVPDTLFTAEHRKAHPVRIGAPTEPVRQLEAVGAGNYVSEGEHGKILDQMRALGYLED